MPNRFAEMDCFVLAGGEHNFQTDFEIDEGLTRLEKGYRRYAAIFERVKLVLKEEQVSERYLNYPHICDKKAGYGAAVGIEAALDQAESDPVFIGSSDLTDFPLELAVDLVRQYQGELFLGYRSQDLASHGCQPLFGIFSKKLAVRLKEIDLADLDLSDLLEQAGRLLPLPDKVAPDKLGLG